MERSWSLENDIDEDDGYDEFFEDDSVEKRQKTASGARRRLSDKNSRQVNITYLENLHLTSMYA